MNSQKSDEKVVQMAIFHKDKFFEKFGLNLQKGQKLYTDAIIRSVLLKQGKRVVFEVARQSGKTTASTYIILWLMLFYNVFREQIKGDDREIFEIGVGAPQFSQAKTTFDRLKMALEKVAPVYKINFEEANGNTLRINNFPFRSIVYVFPVTQGSKIESKTLDIFFGDEMQYMDDERFKMAVLPMLASTFGTVCMTGTAGFRLCEFYNYVVSEDEMVEKYIYNVFDIIEQKNEMYEKTGNAEYLNYEKHYLNEVKSFGEQSDYIKSQYLLEWVLERNMFVSPAKMSKICVNLSTIKQDLEGDIFIGIDCAKESDSTVCCAWRWELYQRPEWSEAKKCLRVLDWYVINKELYSDQWEVLEQEFINNYKLYKLNIDGTGSGDGTADWFLKKYDKINYDIFKSREANNRRGTVRPIKFTAQSKNVMYKELQKLIEEDRLLVPINHESFGYNKFVLESKMLLKEYKGDLMSVHHNDEAGATDDCWDALAMTCYDIDLPPINSQPLHIAKFKVEENLQKQTQREITEKWLNNQLRRKTNW